MIEDSAANEQEWANPDNWSDEVFALYFSKRDSRTWVPKRHRELGWTLNLAHAAGAAWFIGLLLSPTPIVLLVLFFVLAKVR